MFDIKKFFGHCSSEETSTQLDSKITKAMSLGEGLRPNAPTTTTFNRKLVMGILAIFVLIFAASFFFGMDDSASVKQKLEEAGKDKKITNTAPNTTQLDKLPSSYAGKALDAGMPNGINSVSKAQTQNSSALPRQTSQVTDNTRYSSPPVSPRQSVDYSSPPISPRSPVTSQQLTTTPINASNRVGGPAVDANVNKEEQELMAARKSPIRFNLK